MRPFAILMRLMLCLALLANGTVSAFANTRMASHAVQPPCHEMAMGDHASPPPASHDECCPPGACLCACVAQVATLPVFEFGVVAFAHAPPVAMSQASHASPALANPIRPPIGQAVA